VRLMNNTLYDTIATPTLLLDENTCRNNIQRMAEKAQRLGLALRPHFKTPQSRAIGAWFRDYGIQQATVSSLSMAAYFAENGWQDLTVAFPLNLREVKRARALSELCRLQLTLENLEAVRSVEKEFERPLEVWVKINIGNNRTGIRPQDRERLAPLLEAIHRSKQLHLQGFLSHAGQSYAARGEADIAQVHSDCLEQVQFLRQQYQSMFPDLKISLGDTPTASKMAAFPGVDELRPGNFAFYDLMQWEIGACGPADIAVAMACPVVAKHPERREIVLYGGAVHFSKDCLHFSGGTPYYGRVAVRQQSSWAALPAQNYVARLSQEHGIVAASSELLEATAIGSLMHILPVHSCLTANLMKGYTTLQGQTIDMMPARY